MEQEDWNEDDSLRPLTREGEKQLAKVASAMKKMGLDFDLILSSPYERARKTAQIIADKLEMAKRLKFSDDLKCEGDPAKLIGQLVSLKPQPDNLLLVGHEPYLSELVAQWVADNGGMTLEFKKAGLCKLKADELSLGRCARLCWLLTPKQLELMG